MFEWVGMKMILDAEVFPHLVRSAFLLTLRHLSRRAVECLIISSDCL